MTYEEKKKAKEEEYNQAKEAEGKNQSEHRVVIALLHEAQIKKDLRIPDAKYRGLGGVSINQHDLGDVKISDIVNMSMEN